MARLGFICYSFGLHITLWFIIKISEVALFLARIPVTQQTIRRSDDVAIQVCVFFVVYLYIINCYFLLQEKASNELQIYHFKLTSWVVAERSKAPCLGFKDLSPVHWMVILIHKLPRSERAWVRKCILLLKKGLH